MEPLTFAPGRSFARSLDATDELHDFRSKFVITDPNLIYMDGNSLGRLPVETAGRVSEIISQQWGDQLIRSWGQGWFDAPNRIGDKLAGLLGAAPGQVVISDSTSVNLFKMVLAALALRPDRTKIITDDLNFPSDLYILQGCIRLLGGKHILQVVPSPDKVVPDLQALETSIDKDTALVTLSHVVFKSGYMYEAAAVARRAH